CPAGLPQDGKAGRGKRRACRPREDGGSSPDCAVATTQRTPSRGLARAPSLETTGTRLFAAAFRPSWSRFPPSSHGVNAARLARREDPTLGACRRATPRRRLSCLL